VKYIEQLPVSEETRAQLRSLGAETPEALLGLIEAAPGEFERMTGSEAAGRIRAALRGMVQWHPEAMTEPGREYGLGAALANAPSLRDPGFDLEKRDLLHAELVRLQAQDAEGNRARIADLEKQLNALLDDRFG
jgi:hypothetical protein